MKWLLAIAAVSEALTGLMLVVYPPIVVRLLVGAEIAGAGILASRVAGTALVGLGIACWPGAPASRALAGMLTYSTVLTLYLVYLGIGGEWPGVLLWPAAAFHALLSLLLTWAWMRGRSAMNTKA